MAIYHAFHYGRMNQSYKLEDERNQSLYEANLVNFRLFGASDYEFVNCRTAATVTRKVGKTVTAQEGAGNFHMTTASYFKLDGRNCFEVLEEMGYSFRILAKFDLLHPEFALLDKSGNQVAVYRMNVSGKKEEGVNGIGGKQSNTVITTESSDMEAIFLGAFIMGRVEYSRYLL